RAHLNDLENIPAFWVIGYLYITTNPSFFCAITCFRGFAALRILHSVAYLLEIMPIRGVSFMASLAINIYMAVNVILYYLF
ncbi:UNVERIFIED_CONTAM: hypothetical protein GTU68_052517, partial [Idotea baltica]|nr:hypothetical protein [Idotea baltica]